MIFNASHWEAHLWGKYSSLTWRLFPKPLWGAERCIFSILFPVPPSIRTTGPAERSVVLNQPISLECVSSGVPPPSLTWLKDGRPVDTTHGHLKVGSLIHSAIHFVIFVATHPSVGLLEPGFFILLQQKACKGTFFVLLCRAYLFLSADTYILMKRKGWGIKKHCLRFFISYMHIRWINHIYHICSSFCLSSTVDLHWTKTLLQKVFLKFWFYFFLRFPQTF